MTLRSRIADRPVPAVKAFGGSEPPAMAQAAENVSQMGMSHPFAPGEPIGPYDGYSRTSRAFNFGTGYNIATRPRTHERVSFETLKGLIGAYDVADTCIWHRIDSIRGLDWKLIAADHFDGDVTDAIPIGLAALDKPDRTHYFETWLGKWLYGELAYGAGALERMRNRAGRCVGLRAFDGTTIAPLLDYWGDSPGAQVPPGEPLPEAYVQYVNGLPWNWLTRADLIYEPYRLHNDSPYGKAPIESVMLNANTDIRFQVYFLQRYTEGNLPAAFASAPESWTPDQIEQFQELWDSFMYGDQSRKHQIRWIPGGSSFAWSDEKEFTDHFSLFMMRKTCAAFHVVPADLGYTENVNRSSGESQADVQHRVGDSPFIRYVSRIITGFLQDDLGLPLKHQFDLGEEQVDRREQAEADKVYIDLGVIGASEIREMRYGRPEPEGHVVPRFINSSRGGPIPLAALMAVAGPVDPATGAPVPGAELPHKVFGGTEGVLPVPPIKVMSLAEQEFGPSAMPPAPPPQPKMTDADVTPQLALPAAPVAKEGEGAPTAGITSETGITSYDLVGQDDDDEEPEPAAVAKEMAAFRRFERARRKAGAWRDFTFEAADPVRAHRLNDAGRLAVRKAAGEVAVAGLAVLAADTGRVLMLQRALCDDDPAAGTWEFPGGHLEHGETPLSAAWREYAEETRSVPPPGVQTGTWTAGDGIYQGIVWTVESEACVPVRSEPVVPNPDDPDGDQIESIAFWNPADLPGNPVIRPELLDSIGDVLAALGRGELGGTPSQGDESTCPCGLPVVYDEGNGWQHGDGSVSHDDGESVSGKMAAVAKAGDRQVPKAQARPSPDGRAVTTGHHVVDRLLANAELVGQDLDGLSGSSPAADLSHRVVGQLDPVPVGLDGGAEEPAAQVTPSTPAPRLLGGSLGFGAGLPGRQGLPGSRPPHGPHLRGGEPEIMGTAPLGDLVGDVDLISTEKQMIGPHARRVVAPMEDLEPVRDRLVDDLPRDAVGKHRLAPGRTDPLDPENAVVTPIGIPGGHPFPASGRLVDLDPETGNGGVVNSGSHQVSVSKAAWPGWKLDRKTAAHWAPLVTAAVTRALPRSRLNGIAGDYLAANPGQQGDAPGKRERNAAAAGWLAGQGVPLSLGQPLDGLAPGIVTDGHLIGSVSAAAMVSGLKADTGGWQPGDDAKARERAGELGAAAALTALLTAGSNDVADQMAGGYLDALARVLAGADDEISAGDLGGALSEAIISEDLAASLVMTQITIATGQAAMDYYMANGVGYGRWVSAGDSKVCPRCLQNAAAGRVRIGQPYPSGDTSPPIHVHDRCAVVPDWA